MTGGGQSEITEMLGSTFIVRPQTQTRLQSLPLLSDRRHRQDYKVYLYCQTADKTTKSTCVLRQLLQTRLQSLPLLSDRRQDYKVYLCPETAVTDKTTKSTFIIRPQTSTKSTRVLRQQSQTRLQSLPLLSDRRKD